MTESFRDFEAPDIRSGRGLCLGLCSPAGSAHGILDRRRTGMCYEEGFLRYWATRKAENRQRAKPVTERDPPLPVPIRPAGTPEAERRENVERELEEIV